MPICKLCMLDAKLEDSHILPRAIQKQTKFKGKAVRIGLDTGRIVRTQTDAKEYMLCHECEQKFSRHEKAAIEYLRSIKQHLSACTPIQVPVNKVESLIYFAQSVFWRASVSHSLPGYSLPGEIEDALRVSLCSGRALLPPKAPVRIYTSPLIRLHDGQDPHHVFTSPGRDDWAGYVGYSWFLVFGVVFTMDETLGAMKRPLVHRVLNPSANSNYMVRARGAVRLKVYQAMAEASALKKGEGPFSEEGE